MDTKPFNRDQKAMKTKKKLIEEISYQYLKNFVAYTGVLRSTSGYYTKKAHVKGLVRALTKSECRFLNEAFHSEISAKRAADKFNQEIRPNEETLRSEFYNWIRAEVLQNPVNETLISEFPIGDNRADIVRFNGNSYAYELKSPRDSMKRVEKQIETYKKAFDYVYLVVNQQVDCLPSDEEIGIIEYVVPEFGFEITNEAIQLSESDPYMQLQGLRKSELQEIESVHPPMDKQDTVEKLSANFSPDVINCIFIDLMKSRKNSSGVT